MHWAEHIPTAGRQHERCHPVSGNTSHLVSDSPRVSTSQSLHSCFFLPSAESELATTVSVGYPSAASAWLTLDTSWVNISLSGRLCRIVSYSPWEQTACHSSFLN